MSAKRIVVIGDVMLDVVVRPTREVAATSDTPSSVRLSRGGSGANLAVALATQGHEVLYIGAAGDDVGSRMFVEELTRGGVRGDLEITAGSTGVVVALVAPDGQRAMLTDRGANRALSFAHVAAGLAEPFDHLHVSGYTLLDDATRETGVAAIRVAVSRGASTSVDVCSLAPLIEVTPHVFLSAAKGSSMLFANEEEAVALSGTDDVDAAIDLLSGQFGEVVVTRGVDGAVVRCGSGLVRSRSLAQEVVDTTGAGDAATGAYLGARLRGASLDEALTQAMVSASLVVRGLGSTG